MENIKEIKRRGKELKEEEKAARKRDRHSNLNNILISAGVCLVCKMEFLKARAGPYMGFCTNNE